MVSTSASTSVLNAMNVIQYSASGYENAEIFFGETFVEEVNTQSLGIMEAQFTAINMKKFFLLNANLSIAPIFIVLLVYVIWLIRKFHTRKIFL